MCQSPLERRDYSLRRVTRLAGATHHESDHGPDLRGLLRICSSDERMVASTTPKVKYTLRAFDPEMSGLRSCSTKERRSHYRVRQEVLPHSLFNALRSPHLATLTWHTTNVIMGIA